MTVKTNVQGICCTDQSDDILALWQCKWQPIEHVHSESTALYILPECHHTNPPKIKKPANTTNTSHVRQTIVKHQPPQLNCCKYIKAFVQLAI